MRRVTGERARLRGGVGEGADLDPGVGLALGGGRGGAGFCFAFAFVVGVGAGGGGGDGEGAGAGPSVTVLLPAVLGLEVAKSARVLAFFLTFPSALSGRAEADGWEDESPWDVVVVFLPEASERGLARVGTLAHFYIFENLAAPETTEASLQTVSAEAFPCSRPTSHWAWESIG